MGSMVGTGRSARLIKAGISSTSTALGQNEISPIHTHRSALPHKPDALQTSAHVIARSGIKPRHMDNVRYAGAHSLFLSRCDIMQATGL